VGVGLVSAGAVWEEAGGVVGVELWPGGIVPIVKGDGPGDDNDGRCAKADDALGDMPFCGGATAIVVADLAAGVSRCGWG
jgi:hypothetical protein